MKIIADVKAVKGGSVVFTALQYSGALGGFRDDEGAQPDTLPVSRSSMSAINACLEAKIRNKPVLLEVAGGLIVGASAFDERIGLDKLRKMVESGAVAIRIV